MDEKDFPPLPYWMTQRLYKEISDLKAENKKLKAELDAAKAKESK
jgi:hypothetical protein